MKKYLYLTQPDWSKAWTTGGEIPIFLASRYRAGARSGVFTPDENLIHDSPVDIRLLMRAGVFSPDSRFQNFSMINCSVNGQKIPDIRQAQFWEEDGLILSFCNVFDRDIATRLEKRACVEINNINHLINHLNRGLGKTAKHAPCEYTTCHRRNHFLKSEEDAWQQEYRLFWRISHETRVTLPPGIGKTIWIEGDS